ncbi:MAG: CoA transferase [Ectothiorhodospiraceae bacterium]|nr:CoA transferase [Chromatiales bacterium]MCP5157038.1 CoA transferase [Ectothiorhodospiraceae bacterium]
MPADRPSDRPATSAVAPLANIKVVELGTSVAAPYAAWILAALGADVIKVERPEVGDDARQWGRMFPDGTGSYFAALNRDKRGIVVDLEDPDELAWLRRLCIEEADVVLQNMRPGKIDKHGLGAHALRAENPRLVYCNMGAFGARGPLADRPGYDPLMQAYGGIMSVTGEEGRPPIRVGTSIIDMGTGMWSVIGILSALKRRAETGEGCVVDTSLYETSLGWVAHLASTVQATGENPERQGSGARGMAPYQAYECADGWLVVAAPNDRLFARLCAVLECSALPADPRFATNQLRFQNLDQLNAVIAPRIRAESRETWRARLEAAGVPNAPVRTILEVMADEQARALGMLQQLPGCDLELMGAPLSFDGERPPLRRHAPRLGEHDAEIKGG